MWDIEDLEKNGLEMKVGDKVIKVNGHFIGNLFSVGRQCIDNNTLLTDAEKEKLIRHIRSNKNLLLLE